MYIVPHAEVSKDRDGLCVMFHKRSQNTLRKMCYLVAVNKLSNFLDNCDINTVGYHYTIYTIHYREIKILTSQWKVKTHN